MNHCKLNLYGLSAEYSQDYLDEDSTEETEDDAEEETNKGI